MVHFYTNSARGKGGKETELDEVKEEREDERYGEIQMRAEERSGETRAVKKAAPVAACVPCAPSLFLLAHYCDAAQMEDGEEVKESESGIESRRARARAQARERRRESEEAGGKRGGEGAVADLSIGIEAELAEEAIVKESCRRIFEGCRILGGEGNRWREKRPDEHRHYNHVLCLASGGPGLGGSSSICNWSIHNGSEASSGKTAFEALFLPKGFQVDELLGIALFGLTDFFGPSAALSVEGFAEEATFACCGTSYFSNISSLRSPKYLAGRLAGAVVGRFLTSGRPLSLAKACCSLIISSCSIRMIYICCSNRRSSSTLSAYWRLIDCSFSIISCCSFNICSSCSSSISSRELVCDAFDGFCCSFSVCVPACISINLLAFKRRRLTRGVSFALISVSHSSSE
mmetsp:Transcript_37300/g.76464  ORF Transcript_37300/g.76464 Transcript_37300/m.76464 type:complete len:404 (+) Transcript_37300:21-1232(+)